jgi:predicted phage tail protein
MLFSFWFYLMGSSSSSRRPSITPVTGVSNDFVEVLLGLSEGQVEGLVGGGQGIFLDDTPFENPDGSINFPELQYRFFDGSITQDVSSAVSEQSSITNVSVEVRAGIPVTRSIANPDITAIRIRLGVQLQRQTSNGGVERNSINYRILLRTGGGAFVEVVSIGLNERYSSLTVFEYLIPVDPAEDNFTVRVEKLSPNGNTSDDIKTLTWLTYSEVNQVLLEYANTCVVRTQFPSSLFSSNPSSSFLLAGILWDIPTNATINPTDRMPDYAGGWDGTFYKAPIATCDPAWIVYGLCVNERFGLGIPAQYIDKWALYQCSLYNSAFVSDGFGGQERRFTFNAILSAEQGGIDGLRSVCASFAAKPYWNGTQISFWQDRPEISLPKILCNSDVENGRFNYTSGEYLTITTHADVFWQNPEERYNSVPESVSFPTAIERYGIFRERFTALGETRRGGANRAGRRIILSSLPANNQQFSCKVRPRALFFRPGDVVQVADSARGRQRKAGLIQDATAIAVALDAPTTITDAVDRRILVTLPDEATEERLILNPAGTHTVIEIDSPFSIAPVPHSTWQIVDGAIDLVKYRILSVEPDSGNPNLFQVVGKLYREQLYDEIETGWNLTQFATGDRPPVIMPPPRNLVIDIIGTTLDAYWEHPEREPGIREAYTSFYIAEYRVGLNGEWRDRRTITEQFTQWGGFGFGTFFVRVAAISSNGKVSAWVEESITSEPPPPPPPPSPPPSP